MNYNQTMNWLFAQLPMFQRVGKVAYKADLENITKFCAHLGNPQNQFKTIHVAGTNGKGSTSHMVAAVLQEAGYKVGLHTSPHLKHFGERSRINGENMVEDFIIEFIQNNKIFIEDNSFSFFEVAVAMGFLYFAENQVDIAVIETGLGGRLDSTNIISPVLSIITNIGLDHTDILGDTLEKIAAEKAGIIKYKTPVVIGEYTDETKAVFLAKAERENAKIYFAQDSQRTDYTTDLKGIYQKKNVKTAVSALQILQNQGFNISEKNIVNGLLNVNKNTGLRGRWDILQKNPLIVADTAHNPAGITQIMLQINETEYDKLHLVLGFVGDKDVAAILQMFPQDATYYFTEPNVPRKMLIEELQKHVPKSMNARFFNSVNEALSEAKIQAKPNDFIYIGGSTFVVAEVI